MPSLLQSSPYKTQVFQTLRGLRYRGVSVLLMVGTTIALVPTPLVRADVTKPEPSISQEVLEDIPEEVLRSEILLDGRSPVTGDRLSATEYAELQSDIEQANAPLPQVAPKLRTLVGLIKLRKFIKTVLPIVPIK